MSHIAKFNLTIENEQRLRAALAAIGCTVTEGVFENPWASMNRSHGKFRGNQCYEWDGKPVVFGVSMKRIGRDGQPTGTSYTHYGFTRDADGGLCLVGDDYTLGLGKEFIQNAIANSYVNEGVNETVPVLEALGYVEQADESAVLLQRLN